MSLNLTPVRCCAGGRFVFRGEMGFEARPEGQHDTVLIGDNGPGIPDATRARIFDPFFTTKAVGEGSGLGLDIVRRIVEQHDGTIHVESQQGNTEFIVHLPRTV